MRLARFGPAGQERPVAAGADGVWRDLSAVTDDITGAFLAAGLGAAREALPGLPEVAPDGRFGPPLAGIGQDRVHRPELPRPRRRDRRRHAGRADGVPQDRRTRWSARTMTCWCRGGSTKTDYEVELARRHRRPGPLPRLARATRGCVAGYAISNDVSEREFQIERGGQWDKGKNCETFNPLGPWLVTADEVADPQALGLRLWVNGEFRQDGDTRDMIFGVDHVVWYLSQFMVLRPGDVINTGTPAGVAMGTTRQAVPARR